ncbi:MAG: class I adenylate-forming enzyme family protein [Halieaceae bacterium]|nr:class I adenylate-forming enzyme family protein [Halieaceae bacterium]
MFDVLNTVWEEMVAKGSPFEIVDRDIHGVSQRDFKTAPPNLSAFWRATEAHGDRDYIVYQDERISYVEAHKMTRSIAQYLHQNGVKQGDRVAIAMRNYPEYMLIYWAVVCMGASVVGMNAWWVDDEMAYALSDAQPVAAFMDQERLERFERIRDQFPDLQLVGVRVAEAELGRASAYSKVLAADSVWPEATLDPDQDACIFYTSGTTGRPKGAQLTHRSCIANALNMVFMTGVQAEALRRIAGAEPSPSAPPPVALVATPLFHVTANNCVAYLATLAGGTLVHMYKWDVVEAMRLIEAEKVTALSAVPVMSREIILHPDFHKYDLSSLSTMGGGGAALQPDLVHKIDKEMATAKPNTGYGMTETSGIITSMGAEFFVAKPASCGRAVPTLEAKCVNDAGQTLPAGEVGELWVRGANVIKGYLNRAEATADSITDGWLHTGDVAYIDEDGCIFLVDRAKDMVIRGGENVYCAEVENAVFSHDAVAECAVFSVPDERLGEEVGAAVYLRPGHTVSSDEIKSHVASQLASFKVPKHVWFVAMPLPRNANGKFVKRTLQETLALADAQ